MWEAQGSGGSSWGWGPSEGMLSLHSEESAAFTASLPRPPFFSPSLLLKIFPPSLPASRSCCLGKPASVQEEAAFPCKTQGRWQLPLLHPESEEDGEGMAKRGPRGQALLSRGTNPSLMVLGTAQLAWHCLCRREGGRMNLDASPAKQGAKNFLTRRDFSQIVLKADLRAPTHSGFSHGCPRWPQLPQGSAGVQSQVGAGTHLQDNSGWQARPLPKSALFLLPFAFFLPPFAPFLPPFALVLPALPHEVGCKALRDEHSVRRERCEPLENGGARASLSHSAAFFSITSVIFIFLIPCRESCLPGEGWVFKQLRGSV